MCNISKNFKINLLCFYPFLSYIGQIIKINLNNIYLLLLLLLFFKNENKKINKIILFFCGTYIFILLGNYLINIKNIFNPYFFDDSKYILVIVILCIYIYNFVDKRDFFKIQKKLFLINTCFTIIVLLIYIFFYKENRILFLQDIQKISPILSSSFAFHQTRIFSGTATFVYSLVSLLMILEILDNETNIKKLLVENTVILLYSIYFSSIINFVGVFVFLFVFFIKKIRYKFRVKIYLFLTIIFLITISLINIDNFLDESLINRVYQSKFLWNEFMNYPIFGKGFGGYVELDGKLTAFKPYLYEMDILSLLMKLGVVGFIAYLIPIIGVLLLLLKLKNELYLIFFGYFILVLVANGGFFSSTLFSYNYSFILVYLLNKDKKLNITKKLKNE